MPLAALHEQKLPAKNGAFLLWSDRVAVYRLLRCNDESCCSLEGDHFSPSRARKSPEQSKKPTKTA
jgi:hypothetical protein